MRPPRLRTTARLFTLPFVVAILIGVPALPATAATPAFVQQNYSVPQFSSVGSTTARFASAQAAGNTNVVIVGWNDVTGAVSNVADSSGNVYTLAVGPTSGSGISQSIYYATNIAAAAAGANIVTVAFSPAVSYPDLRVLEYSGIDTAAPVDRAVANTGNNATASSGT